jgi:hypothetical protein
MVSLILLPFGFVSFWKRPMHLFGAMGSLMFIIGLLSAVLLVYKNYIICITTCVTV